MRDIKLNSFDEMLADMYQVEWELGTAGFPRSHDGLEKAIKLALTMALASRSRVRSSGRILILGRWRVNFFS